MNFHYTIFIIILSEISVSNGYRILAIFPFPGRSHFHVLGPIAKSLAQQGHQVDVLSHFKLDKQFPNYTELEFPIVQENARLAFNVAMSCDYKQKWAIGFQARICDMLGHPTITKLIKDPPTNPPYDALIIHVLVGVQCLTAIGHMLDVPVIGVVTTMVSAPYQRLMGNPLSLAIVPGHTSYYKKNFTFWERVMNVVHAYSELRTSKVYSENQKYYLKKHLGFDSTQFLELEKSIALLLSNSHYSFYDIKPQTPAIIEIGGINIKNDTSELNPSLKKILDESTSGFIYVSFGTLAAVETLPSVFLNQLFNTFCKISPIRVIMKFSSTDFVPKNLCNNVFIYDWLPQQKLLEHSSIKAFVTHGGGLSSQETIHYAVPIICSPIFADQHLNCDIFTSKNMGVKIDIRTAQPEDYKNAFQKVLSNSQYKESMKKFSQFYWDRPQTPQEAVNYWVEYVIRHGKNILRSPAVDLQWWQFELIDVYCFIFSSILIAVVLSITFIVFIYKIIMQLNSSSKKINVNKKLN